MSHFIFHEFLAEAWVHTLPPDYLDDLRRGRSVVVGNKILAICHGCHTVIQVNKLLFGSVHYCR